MRSERIIFLRKSVIILQMTISLLPRHTRLASLRVILFLGLACRAFRRSHAPLFTGQCLGGSLDSDGHRLSGTQARGDQPPQPDVGDEGRLSRGDFLQALAGVGTSAMAALSTAPQPANALFGEYAVQGRCPNRRRAIVTRTEFRCFNVSSVR